jgi:ABC-type amino acid transport substrate-binding protein
MNPVSIAPRAAPVSAYHPADAAGRRPMGPIMPNLNAAGCRSLHLLALAIVLLTLSLTGAHGRQPVTIGGYAFPPYVEIVGGDAASGLTVEVIHALNAAQDRYDFRFVLTTPQRRYQDFASGRFDAMLFEMPEWGWIARGIGLDVSDEIATDGEVYVALAADGRDERFFDAVGSRKIAGILGYNYGFTGFRNDPDELRDRFDITLVNDHQATIDLVLRGRVELGIVTESFLERRLAADPDARARLLISIRHDQIYSHRVLTRLGASPSAKEIAAMIAATVDGRLDDVWPRHGRSR